MSVHSGGAVFTLVQKKQPLQVLRELEQKGPNELTSLQGSVKL